MKRRHFRRPAMAVLLVSLLTTLLTTTGCTSLTPNLDQHFGEGLRLIKSQQRRNPQAAHNADPVDGIDGKAAKSAHDEYQKSYKAPVPPSNSFTIGIGGR